MVEPLLIKVRLATPADENVLWEMLTYAASMKEESLEEAIRKARADANLSKYVAGFGTRPSDLGVVAMKDQITVGAAWLRLGTDPLSLGNHDRFPNPPSLGNHDRFPNPPSLGNHDRFPNPLSLGNHDRFPNPPSVAHTVATLEEPELAIGVVPEERAVGIGSRLMTELLARSQALFPAVRLSVRTGNPSVRLYERHGFEPIDTVVNRVGGDSLVMRRASAKFAR